MSIFRLWVFRLSSTKWIVSAWGYASATCLTTLANAAPLRLGVTVVKCRPTLGSTTPKILAVPQRLYSLSYLAICPGFRAGRGSRTRLRAFRILPQGHRLLVQTDHRLLRIQRLFVGGQYVLHPLDVFRSQLGHTPPFFPPRL